ncbi:MAG: histidine phosphatase family protein [Pseudomonadota bacterium]
MTQIVLIRHGETLWNSEGRIQGHLDSPLTKTGLAQAQALGNRFKSKNFAALYSSDLGRAYETARRIYGQPILVEPRLRERNLGIFQGMLKRELKTKYPKESGYYKANDANYVIPKGESLKQLNDRSVNCLEELAQKHPGQRILVVAHGGVLVSLFKHTLGIPLDAPRRFLSLNSSVNVFSYQDQTWTLEVWGDLNHL